MLFKDSPFGKIEHIGIAVEDLEESNEVFARLLGVEPYKHETVESEAVRTSFFRSGPNKIELLAATSEDSAIARFLERHKPGIHHIAFAVEDIEAEMIRLRDSGFVLLHDRPKRGADGKLICFLHPKGTQGVLVELCQDIPYDHEAE